MLWAAGVRASPLGAQIRADVDPQGRVLVEPDLSLKGSPNVFVAGDLARFTDQTGGPLPGTAPVAMQQGRYVGNIIAADLRRRTARQPSQLRRQRSDGHYWPQTSDLSQVGPVKLTGLPAWIVWLAVHIYYLAGFKNRLLVVLQWAWSYLTFGRGARLIVGKASPPPLA